MSTEIISSASAHATLSWAGEGWIVEQDRRIFRADAVDVRRIFGDDALDATAEFIRSGSSDWRCRRTLRLGQKAADRIRSQEWSIDLLDETRFSAHREVWTMKAASDVAGIFITISRSKRLIQGGHTIDAGAVDDAFVAWSALSSATPPGDSVDWISDRLA